MTDPWPWKGMDGFLLVYLNNFAHGEDIDEDCERALIERGWLDEREWMRHDVSADGRAQLEKLDRLRGRSGPWSPEDGPEGHGKTRIL